MKTYRQGTNEKVRYVVDFSDRLDDGDTVASVSWTVTDGITTSGSAVTADSVEITAEGGTIETTYTFQAVATTAEGRKHEKTFLVMVVDR